MVGVRLTRAGPELEAARVHARLRLDEVPRGVGPREAHSDLDVARVGPERADDFATVVAGGFGMPDWAKPLAANVVGRPGWSCYVAYDRRLAGRRGRAVRPRGSRLARLRGDAPEFRGRGAQSALLAARIEDARQQGCRDVTTETGELEDDRPSNSYRNIVRAGFREAGARANYRAP